MGRRYTINSDYFKQWSMEMSYWLGFTFSDGCTFTRKRAGQKHEEHLYQVKLRRSDEQHLERLKKVLGYTGPIRYPVEDSAALCIYDTGLVQDLIGLGVVPRKTHVGVSIPKMEDRYKLAFFQGAYDGNGSASTDANGPKVSISGPKGLPEWCFSLIMLEVPEIKTGSASQHGPMSLHCWHGKYQVPRIIKYVLKDTGVPRLERVVARCRRVLEVCH